jgi:hypothetical protein
MKYALKAIKWYQMKYVLKVGKWFITSKMIYD